MLSENLTRTFLSERSERSRTAMSKYRKDDKKRRKPTKPEGVKEKPTVLKKIQTERLEERKVKFRNRQIGFLVGLSLKIMTAEEIRKRSECKIEKEEYVCDLKMGLIDPIGTPCGTCATGLRKCIGHWGHINLAVPIPNPLFIHEIIMILKLFDYNKNSLDR